MWWFFKKKIVCNPITECVFSPVNQEKRLGELKEYEMKSGKTAIYKLVEIEWMNNPGDQYFLYYRFEKYKEMG